MVAGGQFRDHAAVAGVDLDLAVDRMGQQALAVALGGDAGLGAGGLDA
jgi:hypothetical protein